MKPLHRGFPSSLSGKSRPGGRGDDAGSSVFACPVACKKRARSAYVVAIHAAFRGSFAEVSLHKHPNGNLTPEPRREYGRLAVLQLENREISLG